MDRVHDEIGQFSVFLVYSFDQWSRFTFRVPTVVNKFSMLAKTAHKAAACWVSRTSLLQFLEIYRKIFSQTNLCRCYNTFSFNLTTLNTVSAEFCSLRYINKLIINSVNQTVCVKFSNHGKMFSKLILVSMMNSYYLQNP